MSRPPGVLNQKCAYNCVPSSVARKDFGKLKVHGVTHWLSYFPLPRNSEIEDYLVFLPAFHLCFLHLPISLHFLFIIFSHQGLPFPPNPNGLLGRGFSVGGTIHHLAAPNVPSSPSPPDGPGGRFPAKSLRTPQPPGELTVPTAPGRCSTALTPASVQVCCGRWDAWPVVCHHFTASRNFGQKNSIWGLGKLVVEISHCLLFSSRLPAFSPPRISSPFFESPT